MGPEERKGWRKARTLHSHLQSRKMKERNSFEDLDLTITIISKYLL